MNDNPKFQPDLRDFFASSALQTLVPSRGSDTRDRSVSYEDYVAGLAFKFADAMIRARDKTSEERDNV